MYASTPASSGVLCHGFCYEYTVYQTSGERGPLTFIQFYILLESSFRGTETSGVMLGTTLQKGHVLRDRMDHSWLHALLVPFDIPGICGRVSRGMTE